MQAEEYLILSVASSDVTSNPASIQDLTEPLRYISFLVNILISISTLEDEIPLLSSWTVNSWRKSIRFHSFNKLLIHGTWIKEFKSKECERERSELLESNEQSDTSELLKKEKKVKYI